ncbi:glycosyltransferase involved in cell wall biosynthesis [Paucibacter oligotrophus]|uniref:Glycosyltransferase involved in cell wall biosynthesis n=1 Tax=Roseateles oligotrophus TaxID=1769250 RepID=A0A840LA82_9BURK|nr:glycosyltransferase [Roseateles oligotrophus]MBB4843572.1 glycosyltransferase involved in cell wall biosynthesis [Roseateles oligotrophus]
MYRLALVVIARDEAAHIQRLLLSLRPWVDEMLVLDTGSLDDTPALAAAAGARVEHFAWCDDFAAARNAALALAAADWHVVLDADEWLISGGEALAALRQQRPDFVGTIALLDQFTDTTSGGGEQQALSRLSRILPGPVRYAGRVHEQPQHRLPLRPLELRIGHDGYLPAQLQRKRGRNQALLRLELARRPDDAYLWYQTGKDASVYEDYAEAEACFARAAGLSEQIPAWWTDLVARRLFGLKRLKQHEAGIHFAEGQLQICTESPDFFFALGDLLLDYAADQPAQAELLLPTIEDAWRRCLALGERPEQSGAVAGRGSFSAAHNLALLLEGTGRAPEAQVLRQAHGLG